MILRRPHDIADLMRDGRARAGWSQSDLAERVGVSRQWISLVENGKTSVEFELVLGALQALGYRLNVDLPKPTGAAAHLTRTPDPKQPQRTSLTRRGEPLGKPRARRGPRGPSER